MINIHIRCYINTGKDELMKAISNTVDRIKGKNLSVDEIRNLTLSKSELCGGVVGDMYSIRFYNDNT